MEKGLVSVITPTYNCAKFIGETIESVQTQTYQQWEMIIVDDCSTDNTKEIVDKYIKEDLQVALAPITLIIIKSSKRPIKFQEYTF